MQEIHTDLCCPANAARGLHAGDCGSSGGAGRVVVPVHGHRQRVPNEQAWGERGGGGRGGRVEGAGGVRARAHSSDAAALWCSCGRGDPAAPARRPNRSGQAIRGLGAQAGASNCCIHSSGWRHGRLPGGGGAPSHLHYRSRASTPASPGLGSTLCKHSRICTMCDLTMQQVHRRLCCRDMPWAMGDQQSALHATWKASQPQASQQASQHASQQASPKCATPPGVLPGDCGSSGGAGHGHAHAHHPRA
jgi:hypothetical protein